MAVKQMEKKIEALERRMAKLEQGEKRKNGGAARESTVSSRKPVPVATSKKRTAVTRDEVDEILRKAGLLAEPTEYEKQLVAEWLAVPEEERKRIPEEFYNLPFDKSLSDIVIENRR